MANNQTRKAPDTLPPLIVDLSDSGSVDLDIARQSTQPQSVSAGAQATSLTSNKVEFFPVTPPNEGPSGAQTGQIPQGQPEYGQSEYPPPIYGQSQEYTPGGPEQPLYGHQPYPPGPLSYPQQPIYYPSAPQQTLVMNGSVPQATDAKADARVQVPTGARVVVIGNTTCHSCGKVMFPTTRRVIGIQVYAMCTILLFVGCFPLNYLPFFIDSCKDVEQICPNCGARI